MLADERRDVGHVKASDESDRSVRTILLLREVADAVEPITANEISERTGLPKATVYRLCEQLLGAGLIRRQLGGRGYVAGPKLIDLAQSVLASRSVYVTRHAILARLAKEIGETCNLVAPEGGGMVYWDRVETEWPLRLQLPVGSRVPFHATASGKMYLASLPMAQCTRLLKEIELEPHTENTLTVPEVLQQHLLDTRKRGYSLDDEEFIQEMTAIAVPVLDQQKRYVASLAVHAPKSRMTIEHAKGYVDLLKDAASHIGAGVPERLRATA